MRALGLWREEGPAADEGWRLEGRPSADEGALRFRLEGGAKTEGRNARGDG